MSFPYTSQTSQPDQPTTNQPTLHLPTCPPASQPACQRGGELFLTVRLAENWGVAGPIRGGHFVPIFAA